jgi:hypothetical protein
MCNLSYLLILFGETLYKNDFAFEILAFLSMKAKFLMALKDASLLKDGWSYSCHFLEKYDSNTR